MKKLSPKERKFVAEYLKDENGTQAAIRAGYSQKTATTQASRLLRKAHIRAAVDAKIEKVEEKAVVNKAYVISSLKEVAERSMQHVPVMEFDHVEKEMVQKKAYTVDGQTGRLKEVGIYEFDSTGANRSLELLGKSMKLFTDKIDLNVKGNLSDHLQQARERLKKPPMIVPIAPKIPALNGHSHENGAGQ